MSKTPPKRRGDWVTARQAAGFLGISQQAFRSGWLPDLDAADVRPGRPATVFAPAVVELAVGRAVEGLGGAAVDDIESGPVSPELERLRRVRRLREERDFGISLRELVPASIFWTQAEEVWVHVQRFVGEMIQAHGPLVRERWADVAAEAETIARRYAPELTRKRTLILELDDGETVKIPLPLNEGG
ncbi:MAG: hypothetical protein GXX96_11895 [Planctomycetaceae bacterium]|nr:hypothetical protein [Planctomycetaceae bacterium]